MATAHFDDESKLDVLVVDDRQEGLLALEAVLSRLPVNLVKAQSGREALGLLDHHDFAVILLDVQMPGLDGFQTATILRQNERYKLTPLLFVTAINKDEQYVHRGYEIGAVDYVFKPFDPVILRSKVSVLLELHRKNRQLEQQAELIRENERRERYLRIAELEVESLRRYRMLADAVPHIVWRASSRGVLEYFNKGWVDYTGLSVDMSTGTGWQSMFHVDDLREFLKLWLKKMETQDSFEIEARIRSSDGTFRWHLIKGVPERHCGEVMAWIGTCTDIHDRKQMELRLREAQRQAEIASRAKSQFLANMSHEIRTPLGAMLGYAELLLEPDQNEEERLGHAKVIRRSGQELLKIIDEILDLSKVEAGRLEVELLDVRLKTLLDEIKRLLEVQASTKNLSLEIQVDKDVPERVLTDPTRLRQILVNLVGNAIKFTNEGGVILQVSYGPNKTGAKRLQFRIHDSGVGIETDQQVRLFQPFVQVDSSTTRRFGGTGLGLALSKRLANRLGGDVMLERSQAGKGSTFLVEIQIAQELPVMGQGPGAASAEPGKTHAARSSKETESIEGLSILLVEDSLDNQILLKRFLTGVGAKVELASNGFEGMEKALAQHFDVVLMDIQMPQLDGYEATSRLRQAGYTRPIIALTAHALKEERDRCIQAGCTDHLTKPIDKKSLISQVARAAQAARTGQVSKTPSQLETSAMM